MSGRTTGKIWNGKNDKNKLERFTNFQKEIKELEEKIKALEVDKKEGDQEEAGGSGGCSSEGSSGNGSLKGSSGNISETGEDGAGPSREIDDVERLQSLIRDISEGIDSDDVNEEALKAMLAKATELCDEGMNKAIRKATEDSYGAPIAEPKIITHESIVAAMNSDEVADFDLSPYLQKPEKPPGISKGAYMDILKKCKKYADAFVHVMEVLRSAKTEELKVYYLCTDLGVLEEFEVIDTEHPMKKAVGRILGYELIQRTKTMEYFYCFFCNTAWWSVRQALSHFGHKAHYAEAMSKTTAKEIEMGTDIIGLSFVRHAATVQLLAPFLRDLHNVFCLQYSLPFAKTGMKVPTPEPSSRPTEKFTKYMEDKYGKAINGDADPKKFEDPNYVASIYPGVVANHKSKLGLELFKEFDKHLSDGKTFFCIRCRWKFTAKERYYKHIKNILHCSIYEMYGDRFDLLTLSVNIHMREL